MGQTFNETPPVAYWSGGDNARARQSAAESIMNMINDHSFAESEKLNVVGHSHGGNIGILVSQMTDRKIDNLVTLGVPVRSDYQANYEMIGNHVNAYSSADPVQLFLGGKGGYDFLLPRSFDGVNGFLQHFLEFGPAGRKFDGAENIAVTRATGWGPRSAHSDLWQNSGVWYMINSGIVTTHPSAAL